MISESTAYVVAVVSPPIFNAFNPLTIEVSSNSVSLPKTVGFLIIPTLAKSLPSIMSGLVSNVSNLEYRRALYAPSSL